jgi:hypothetical protein
VVRVTSRGFRLFSPDQRSRLAAKFLGQIAKATEVRFALSVEPFAQISRRNIEALGRITQTDLTPLSPDSATELVGSGHAVSFAYTERCVKPLVRLTRTIREIA